MARHYNRPFLIGLAAVVCACNQSVPLLRDGTGSPTSDSPASVYSAPTKLSKFRILSIGNSALRFNSNSVHHLLENPPEGAPDEVIRWTKQLMNWMDTHPKTLSRLEGMEIPSNLGWFDGQNLVYERVSGLEVEYSQFERESLNADKAELGFWLSKGSVKDYSLGGTIHSDEDEGRGECAEEGGKEGGKGDRKYSLLYTTPVSRCSHLGELLEVGGQYAGQYFFEWGVPFVSRPTGAAALNQYIGLNYGPMLSVGQIKKVVQNPSDPAFDGRITVNESNECSAAAYAFSLARYRPGWSDARAQQYFQHIRNDYFYRGYQGNLRTVGAPPGDILDWNKAEVGNGVTDFRNMTLKRNGTVGELAYLVENHAVPIVMTDLGPGALDGSHYVAVVGMDDCHVIVNDSISKTAEPRVYHLTWDSFLASWRCQVTLNYLSGVALTFYAAGCTAALLGGPVGWVASAVAFALFTRTMQIIDAIGNTIINPTGISVPYSVLSVGESFRPTPAIPPAPTPLPTPVPRRTAPPSAGAVSNFRFLGKDADRVGLIQLSPDGQSDGHFKIDVTNPGGRVCCIFAEGLDPDGRPVYWDSWDPRKAPLATYLGAKLLNPTRQTYWTDLGPSRVPRTLDLFLGDQVANRTSNGVSVFRPGTVVNVYVYVENQQFPISSTVRLGGVNATPAPVPSLLPRSARYHALTSWTDTRSRQIIGARSTISHVTLTATDKGRGGIASEVMWLRGRPNNWLEVGFTDAPSTSNAVSGKCFYWANADVSLGRYQEYAMFPDTDNPRDLRGYWVQRVNVNVNGQLVPRYQIYVSGKNDGIGNWRMMGTASLFTDLLTASDHGLEISNRDNRGAFGAGQVFAAQEIKHLFGNTWFPVDGNSYIDSNQNSAFPRFFLDHNLADKRPANNHTFNREVP